MSEKNEGSAAPSEQESTALVRQSVSELSKQNASKPIKTSWETELDRCRRVRTAITVMGCIDAVGALALPYYLLYKHSGYISAAIGSASPEEIAAMQIDVASVITPQLAAIVIGMLLTTAFLLSYSARLSRAIINECEKHDRMVN